VLVKLRLDDVIEATIDGGKAVVHFFAESADFAVKLANVCADFRDFSSDVLALLFDEARKLVELGLLLLWHAGQYTMSPDDAGRRAIRSGERGRGASDMQKSVVADRGLHAPVPLPLRTPVSVVEPVPPFPAVRAGVWEPVS
jgi:hypothetical protein